MLNKNDSQLFSIQKSALSFHIQLSQFETNFFLQHWEQIQSLLDLEKLTFLTDDQKIEINHLQQKFQIFYSLHLTEKIKSWDHFRFYLGMLFCYHEWICDTDYLNSSVQDQEIINLESPLNSLDCFYL